MELRDPELLSRIEDLIHKSMAVPGEDHEASVKAATIVQYLIALGDAVLQNRKIFDIEPWHPVQADVPLSMPGEMLLRLKDAKGQALAPYPAIMWFYKNDLHVEIDSVLFLCGLRQFAQSDEKQVSINISARSLRHGDFITCVIKRMKKADLGEGQKIILEIHEGLSHMKMSADVLKMMRNAGLAFAIDDVGLSMNDVFRLSDFEDIADYIKLDRKSVQPPPGREDALENIVSFITATLPRAVMVAEGVEDTAHARALHHFHPAIKYVQGLNLPGRQEFLENWKK